MQKKSNIIHGYTIHWLNWRFIDCSQRSAILYIYIYNLKNSQNNKLNPIINFGKLKFSTVGKWNKKKKIINVIFVMFVKNIFFQRVCLQEKRNKKEHKRIHPQRNIFLRFWHESYNVKLYEGHSLEIGQFVSFISFSNQIMLEFETESYNE